MDEKNYRSERRRKRRQKVLIAKIIVFVLLLVVLGELIFVLSRRNSAGPEKEAKSGNEQMQPTVEPTQEPTETPTPTPTQKPVKVISEAGLHSDHAILIRLSDKAVMMRKADGERTYPASITKIMTAIVAMEQLEDLDRKITLSPEMFERLYKEGASMAGFLPGESVTVRDLLYGVMLPSGAEACIGLAEEIAGSEEGFVDLMNRKAEALGMAGTNFVTSTGLHDENHYTTASDMAHLLIYALQNEEFRKIFTASSYTIAPSTAHPEGLTFKNTMFKRMQSPELPNGGVIEGGKTGYTSDAGLCLASLAKIGEEEYILVTTNADGDHTTEQFNITDAFTAYGRI